MQDTGTVDKNVQGLAQKTKLVEMTASNQVVLLMQMKLTVQMTLVALYSTKTLPQMTPITLLHFLRLCTVMLYIY